MAGYKEACDNRIYLITSNIIYLLISNIWFLVTISPLIIYFFTSGEGLSIPILTFLGILIGPALSTMFSVTGKLIEDKHSKATKDYFHFYKLNFAQGVFIAAIMNLILMIAYIDIPYFLAAGNSLLAYVFICIAVLIGAVCLYVYPIVSRINVKTIDLFKISIKLVFKKFYITLTNISLLIIGFSIVKFTNIALIAVLFGCSGICYLILRMESNILKEVEVFFKEKYLN